MDEQKQAPCPLHMEVAGVDRINYALNQNKIPVIRQVTLVNRADCDLQNVILKIQANPAFALPLEKVIQLIPTGQTLVLDEIDLVLETSFLSALTERLLGTLQIELHHQGECLVAMTRGISILAFDEWQANCWLPLSLKKYPKIYLRWKPLPDCAPRAPLSVYRTPLTGNAVGGI